MDTEGPLNPASEEKHYIYVLIKHFSKYTSTLPTLKDPQYAVNSLIQILISQLGPPHFTITDRGTKYFKTEIANCCTLFKISLSVEGAYKILE